jgi:hypothetical protein
LLKQNSSFKNGKGVSLDLSTIYTFLYGSNHGTCCVILYKAAYGRYVIEFVCLKKKSVNENNLVEFLEEISEVKKLLCHRLLQKNKQMQETFLKGVNAVLSKIRVHLYLTF